MTTSYVPNQIANDRSGPFERVPMSPVVTRDNVEEWQLGLTPSMEQTGEFSNMYQQQNSLRMPSQLHQMEINPFDNSFNEYSYAVSPVASNDYYAQSDQQYHAVQKRSHSPGVEMPPSKIKRPLMSQIQGSGNMSDGSRQASSFGTVLSTATESGNESSSRDSPFSMPSKRNSLSALDPVDRDTGSDTSSSNGGNSSTMSRSMSLNTGRYTSVGRTAPASANDYEQMVRAYAQQNAHHTQNAPKALPSDAMQALKQAHEQTAWPAIQPIQAPKAPATVPVLSPKAEAAAPIMPAPAIAKVMPAPLPAFEDPTSAAKPPAGKRGRGRAAKEAKDPEEDKRAQFLERNRVAACKSRQKKKEWIASLESCSEDLTKQNSDLQKTVTELRDEVSQLRSALAAHAGCSCAPVHALKTGTQQKSKIVETQPTYTVPSVLASPKRLSVQNELEIIPAHYPISASINAPPMLMDPALASPATYHFGNSRSTSLSPISYMSKYTSGEQDYFMQPNMGRSEAFSTPDLANTLS